MKRIHETRGIKRSALATSLGACLCLGFAVPLLAAPLLVDHASADTNAAGNTKPAQKCLSDLHALDSQMQKDGYWLRGSGYGYGYPIYGFSYGERGATLPGGTPEATGYGRVRPGYEVRTLIASANILPQRGQQRATWHKLTDIRMSRWVPSAHNLLIYF